MAISYVKIAIFFLKRGVTLKKVFDKIQLTNTSFLPEGDEAFEKVS